MFKAIKRMAAADYSRDLSVKVFAGQSRLIKLGFRQGGSAGYGLRRQLVDQKGVVKGLLARGEWKSIQTDRVVLIPGPPDEVDIIRWIFTSFVKQRKSMRDLARSFSMSVGSGTRAAVPGNGTMFAKLSVTRTTSATSFGTGNR